MNEFVYLNEITFSNILLSISGANLMDVKHEVHTGAE